MFVSFNSPSSSWRSEGCWDRARPSRGFGSALQRDVRLKDSALRAQVTYLDEKSVKANRAGGRIIKGDGERERWWSESWLVAVDVNSGWTLSLWRSLRCSLNGMRRSGTTPRVWHQTDSKTWYLIFLSCADTNSALALIIFSWLQRGRSCTQKESAPRCPCSSFTSNSNNLQIVFVTEDKDVPLVRTLSFWLKEILDLRVPLNWAEGARLHVHAIVSVNLRVNIRHVDRASPYIWFSVCLWRREWGRGCCSSTSMLTTFIDKTQVQNIHHTPTAVMAERCRLPLSD